MDYELVLSFYKSFCTKISDLRQFFREESTFFFVGDSGNTCIAYGREDIEQHIEDQFWSKDKTNADKTLIAYNINIEKKSQILCPNPSSFIRTPDGVAIAVIGILKAIHNEDDIPLTKAMGRRFVQTFLIRKDDQNYIQSTVFAFLAPTTDFFNSFIRTEVTTALSSVSGDIFDGQQKINGSADKGSDLDFEKIVRNIDKLMDENNGSNEDINAKRVDSNNNDLMPISVNEIFDDNADDKCEELNQSFTYEQYLNEVWTQNKSTEEELGINENKNIENPDKNQENKSQDTSDDHNCGTSFADVLRDGLQSWQNIKTEDKCPEIRIITNCSKSKFKQSCLRVSADTKEKFCGQQNITIIGAQNLEDFSDNQIVFVANIPIGYPKNEFRNLFDIYGKVLSTKFVERIGVTFAFIYFDSSKCIDEVFKSTTGNNNLSLSGLQLKVDRYKPRIQGYNT